PVSRSEPVTGARVQTMVGAPGIPIAAAIEPSGRVVLTAVNAEGVKPLTGASDLREVIAANRFCWIDVVGNDEAARGAVIGELGFAQADIAWAQRFGQTGRIAIGRQGVRVSTWVADRTGHSLIEMHVLGSRTCVLTMWE